jgi:hypothetical protein
VFACRAAEARNRAIDDARIDGSDSLEPEPQPIHRARPQVVDKDVSPSGKRQDGPPILRRCQIEPQLPLGAVESDESTEAAIRAAHHVALVALDLGDFGAERRKLQGRKGAGDDVCDIDDAHSFERPEVRCGRARRLLSVLHRYC